jgi:hypothetical protein
MIEGIVTLSRHPGPDGEGLPLEVIEDLIDVIKNGLLTEAQINQAVDLCMKTSTQDQWNEVYMPLLVQRLKE